MSAKHRHPIGHVFPAKLEPDADAFMITFPDFDDAVTYGADETEARAMAADCLFEAIAARMALREDVPIPSPIRRNHVPVVLPTLAAAKVALYRAMRESGMTMAQLARLLACDFQQVRRLLSLSHNSRLDQLDAAFEALGKRLELHVRDAA